MEWLTKMVEPNLKNRYGNAAVALQALLDRDYVVNINKPAVIVGLATLGVVAMNYT